MPTRALHMRKVRELIRLKYEARLLTQRDRALRDRMAKPIAQHTGPGGRACTPAQQRHSGQEPRDESHHSIGQIVKSRNAIRTGVFMRAKALFSSSNSPRPRSSECSSG